MATKEQSMPPSASAAVPTSFSRELLGWVRYLYFLRFSLLLWLLPVGLAVLDRGAASLASGIMVPEYFQGYFCVGFFIVSTGYAALASARVTVVNGPRRFGEAAPAALESLLAHPMAQREWRALALAHLWSAAFLIFLLFFCPDNKGATSPILGIVGQPRATIALGFLLGALAALFFWFVLNAWYYLTYAPVPHAIEEQPLVYEWKELRTPSMCAAPRTPNIAKTMIFPRSWFFLFRVDLEQTVVNTSVTHAIFNAIARRACTMPGYAYKTEEGARLYEGHVFLLMCVLGFVGLYFTIWPIAAPVPVPGLAAFMLTVMGVIAFAGIAQFWTADQRGRGIRVWQTILSIGIAGFWATTLWLYLGTSAERFPILAVVLIMLTGILWALSGVAFFVDRFRIPVLSLIVLNILAFHVWVPFGLDDHYFSTVPLATGVAVNSLPTPAAVLHQRLQMRGADQPLIVVTATGGGLHASAWTANVLAGLERTFPRTPGDGFRDRLLMLSTVSGGSVGLNAYLHALRGNSHPGEDPLDHMREVAQCSSLEAVGWGLVYYDGPKAILPFGPYLLWPSSGDGDLSGSPLFADRTWALRKGIARNQLNAYCADLWQHDLLGDKSATSQPNPQLPVTEGGVPIAKPSSIFTARLQQNLRDESTNAAREKGFTLLGMLPDASTPAFSMNTTSVEQGARFLLSNYVVPHYILDARDGNVMYPAQSFFQAFRDPAVPGGIDEMDLPLATAAQLSATFPYVSSTARAPHQYSSSAGDRPSVHFGDGGYYDNDGTASATEFLRYALADPNGGATGDDQKHLAAIRELLAGKPLRILWIEIRNSGDDDGGKPQTPGGNGGQNKDWTMLGQVGAPLDTFWNAGHESVTGRNRHILALLQQALGCRLSVYRIVIDDENAKLITGTDPLNWSLTPGQREEVRFSATEKKALAKYQQALGATTTWPGTSPCPATTH